MRQNPVGEPAATAALAARTSASRRLKAAGSGRSAISPKKFSCPLYRRPSRKRPLEAALAGLNTGGLGAKSSVLQDVIRSFDPCIDCTVY
ncbi:hypothetical protein AB3480_33980 [Rhizobium mongolense]|uniref:hypothetical protein n=1 Tax=Rhizobium mongolense TaxID=57676 RepID=UPI0034A4C26B